MRTLLLSAFALLALAIAPTTAQPPAAKPDDTVALQIRLLQDRATRAEERLARLEKAAGVVIPELIPFGDLTVNLAEERQQRYLRVKITLRVSDAGHKEVSAMVIRKKAELRNAAITFLVGQSVKDVSSTKGVMSVQDGLKKAFGKVLADGKENPVLDVLFEEYVIQ